MHYSLFPAGILTTFVNCLSRLRTWRPWLLMKAEQMVQAKELQKVVAENLSKSC